MRKRKATKKLSRNRKQRKALLKSLAEALILRGKIKTTEIKAKEVSRFFGRLMRYAAKSLGQELPAEKSLGKEKLAGRRLLAKFLSPAIAKKLEVELAPRYKGRSGGYTRIVKLGPRRNDGAKMAIVELIK